MVFVCREIGVLFAATLMILFFYPGNQAYGRDIDYPSQLNPSRGGKMAPHQEEVRRHMELGEKYLREEAYDQAIEEFKKASQLSPQFPVPHLYLGDIFMIKGLYEEAISEYGKAKDLNPAHPIPYLKIGRYYARKGQVDRAISEFQALIRLHPQEPDFHFEFAQLYRKAGLVQEAEIELQRGEKLRKARKRADPSQEKGVESRRALISKAIGLGDEFLRNKMYDQAISQFKMAAELDPQGIFAHQKLGDAYLQKGMLEEAIKEYEEVKHLSPKSPLSYLGLGVVHARKFEIEKAFDFFQKGLSLDPRFAPLYFEMALAYVREDRLEDGIVSLQKTIELEPRNSKPKEVLERVKIEKEAEAGYLVIQNERFILKYDPQQDRSFVEKVWQSLEKAYEKLVGDLNYQPRQKIIVKLYPDLKQFHYAASTPPWFQGGVASTAEQKILLATPKREVNIEKLPEVITHELTHAFVNLMTYSRHPVWIHEGLALHEAGQWEAGREKILIVAIKEERLHSLDELEEPFTKLKNPREIDLAYAESYTAVEYLIAKCGKGKLKEILFQFARGKSFPEAAQFILGINREEFEKGWVEFLRAKYPK